MESRRDFLKKAALLSSAAVWWSVPESIQKALAIDPEIGSTYLEAEHIVILMQENRSFDHSFGTLRGVRGFNDPRAHRLADQRPVWLQTNKDGETYVPFRLNIKDTNATWMGSLPHSWANQVDARNGGRYDRWLEVKPCYFKGYEKFPMTLGHYTREDIPFYYAFADAFTICDQHFCSSLTGTTPNRLYLWSGTIRPKPSADSKPHVYNEEADFDHEVDWPTFPERLEASGISWKVYQNELTIDTGFKGEEEGWLANFGDNPLEYFTQYNVRFRAAHREYLEERQKDLLARLASTEAGTNVKTTDAQLAELKTELKEVQEGLDRWSKENFEKLPEQARNLHEKAFSVSENDPYFRQLESISYEDAGTERTVQVPKGDVFYQFRKDVDSGNLPTVSWIVGPENFSDHPASAWYGAWYVAEALDILTKDPEVWKKTIFILTYDENDGYFDHIPPFVAPNPTKAGTGLVSEGIEPNVEFVTLEQDKAFRPSYSPRESSIGLGYRVPLVVASPWSRGGCVCSQVFDHTSVLQFLEHFLSAKSGAQIEEPNISDWRRTVCGDLTSIFKVFEGGKESSPGIRSRDEFIEEIHKARFKSPPAALGPLSQDEIDQAKRSPAEIPSMPAQEKGSRPSCPLPYELYADGRLDAENGRFQIHMRAGNAVFGSASAGAPFNVYGYTGPNQMQARAYAVSAGENLSDSWALSEFESGRFHVRIDGPNGFMREFQGDFEDTGIEIRTGYARRKANALTGELELVLINRGQIPRVVKVADKAYGGVAIRQKIATGNGTKLLVGTNSSQGWYDIEIKLEGSDSFSTRIAGHVETGRWSITDPAMGNGYRG